MKKPWHEQAGGRSPTPTYSQSDPLPSTLAPLSSTFLSPDSLLSPFTVSLPSLPFISRPLYPYHPSSSHLISPSYPSSSIFPFSCVPHARSTSPFLPRGPLHSFHHFTSFLPLPFPVFLSHISVLILPSLLFPLFFYSLLLFLIFSHLLFLTCRF